MTLLNWPSWQPVHPGLDTSWQAGTALAFTRHLQWGPAINFTYGPYGFAGFIQPLSRSTALIAICYVFVVTCSLSAMLVAGLRQCFPTGGGGGRAVGLAAAGIISWGIIALCWPVGRAADFAGVTGLAMAVTAVRVGQGPGRTALLAALGALTGFTLLVKLDTGVTLFGILVLALIGTAGEGRRFQLAAQSGAAMASVFVVAWAAAGQSFGHLLSFAHASVSLAVGYSSAMAGDLPRKAIVWYALGLGAITLLTYAAAFRHWPRRQQLACSLMVAGWGWSTLKEGFVSGNHFPGFFRILLVAVALSCLWARLELFYAGALILAVTITFVAITVPSVDPVTSVEAVGTELSDLAQTARFSALTARTRSNVLRSEPLSTRLVARLGADTVAIEPWEDLVAWAAPMLRWDPEPVLQSYSAYTVGLDNLDARFLASKRAPQRILYWKLDFDRRDPAWDPPATMEALYCHYDQLSLSGSWQVLGRVDDRCGPARLLRTVHARFGQWVKVPAAPGQMVVASFAITAPFVSKLDGVVLKPPDTYLSSRTSRGLPVRYRFVPGTAGDDHVLSVPRALGYSPHFTPVTARQLAFSGGGWATGQGSVTVTFLAVSMAGG